MNQLPKHLIGPMRSRDPRLQERRTWIADALASGMTRRQVCEALGVHRAGLTATFIAIEGKRPKDNTNANAARLEKLRERRYGALNGWTYADLHAAGHSATEAAKLRGETRIAALTWARETGNTFPDGRSSPKAKAMHAVRLASMEEKRRAAFQAMLKDPARWHTAALTPEQRAEYDMLVKRYKYRSDEAARMVGVPEASIDRLKADRAARQEAKKAEQTRRQRRAQLRALIAADPETAMLIAMRGKGQ